MSLSAGHLSPTRIYGSRLKPYKRHLMQGVCLEIFCIKCIEAHFVAKKRRGNTVGREPQPPWHPSPPVPNWFPSAARLVWDLGSPIHAAL